MTCAHENQRALARFCDQCGAKLELEPLTDAGLWDVYCDAGRGVNGLRAVIRKHEARMAEIAAQRGEATGWRPIAEAPRDGTLVAVCDARKPDRNWWADWGNEMSNYHKDATHFYRLPPLPEVKS